jgi:hypothetical protein
MMPQYNISVKINISVQAEAHIDSRVESATCLRLSVSTLNTTVKNREEIERSYVQCGPFSKQQISLKRSPLEKLKSALAAWLKEAHESNASTDGWHPPQGEGLTHHHLSGNSQLFGFQWMNQQI